MVAGTISALLSVPEYCLEEDAKLVEEEDKIEKCRRKVRLCPAFV